MRNLKQTFRSMRQSIISTFTSWHQEEKSQISCARSVVIFLSTRSASLTSKKKCNFDQVISCFIRRRKCNCSQYLCQWELSNLQWELPNYLIQSAGHKGSLSKCRQDFRQSMYNHCSGKTAIG